MCNSFEVWVEDVSKTPPWSWKSYYPGAIYFWVKPLGTKYKPSCIDTELFADRPAPQLSTYPTKWKLWLDFIFCYFANGKLA